MYCNYHIKKAVINMRKEEKKNKHQSAVLEEWQHIWIYWCFSLELKHSGFCSIIPKNKNQKKQIENSKNLKFFPNKMIRRQWHFFSQQPNRAKKFERKKKYLDLKLVGAKKAEEDEEIIEVDRLLIRDIFRFFPLFLRKYEKAASFFVRPKNVMAFVQ